MAITFISPSKAPAPWIQALKRVAPDIEVRVWPDDHPREDILFALTWNSPTGIWSAYPNLRGITSLGAGADHLLRDTTLPEALPLARVVDPDLVQSMIEYVLYCVLDGFRNFSSYRTQQQKGQWKPHPPRRIQQWHVGILGAGQLGLAVARALKANGFAVRTWGRTPRKKQDIPYFYGKDALPSFCAKCQALVCLLPLTRQTSGLLNKDLFAMLPQHAHLINVARGGHLEESDLIKALDSGQLARAYLDVVNTEPLPPDHPFWHHPGIFLTPHIASITNPDTAAPQIVENYRLLKEERPMRHQVHRKKGY